MPNTSISFPSSPTLGQQYTYGSTTYIYDGTSWSVDSTLVASPLKLDSTNNRVGINNNAPTVVLDVTGAIKGSTTLEITGATTLSSTLNVTGATTLSNILNVTGATTLSNILNVTGATTLSSTLNVTGNLTVDTNTFFVDATNNRVGIGTTTPATTLDLGTGGQIKFPATQNASSDVNTLDDYEEGTYVFQNADFGGDTTLGSYGLTTTAANKTLHYTKIGNRVFFNGIIVLSSITTAGTGHIRIGNLPFTLNSTGAYNWATCYFNNMTAGTVSILAQWNGNKIYFYRVSSAGGIGAAVLAPADLTATSAIHFTGHGFIA